MALHPEIRRFIWSVTGLVCAISVCIALISRDRPVRSTEPLVCIECGRRAVSVHDDRELVSLSISDERPEFLQRFDALLPRDHVHDWMNAGCVEQGGALIRVRSGARAWIQLLPRLADSAAVEALLREALPLSPDERHALIDEFECAFAGCQGEFDAAFARWNAARKAR